VSTWNLHGVSKLPYVHKRYISTVSWTNEMHRMSFRTYNSICWVELWNTMWFVHKYFFRFVTFSKLSLTLSSYNIGYQINVQRLFKFSWNFVELIWFYSNTSPFFIELNRLKILIISITKRKTERTFMVTVLYVFFIILYKII
jgi:hypothetical protein